MPPGRIIFLNGTSSAGKTSLARALQDALPEPYLHVALDQFRDGMPPAYRGLNSPPGTRGAEGLNVVPVTDTPQAYTDIRFGAMGQMVLRGMRRAFAALADAGNHLIIDDLLLEPGFLTDYLQVLAHLEVTFVGVRCPLPEIERREARRPGRFPGTAFGHFDTVHAHGLYDVEVDTFHHPPAACARQVVEFLAQGRPQAFARLRNRLRSDRAASVHGG